MWKEVRWCGKRAGGQDLLVGTWVKKGCVWGGMVATKASLGLEKGEKALPRIPARAAGWRRKVTGDWEEGTSK